MQKLFWCNCWQNWKKFNVQMRITYNVKYHRGIPLKFVDTFLTSVTKLALEAKASISSAIKKIMFLYCRKFSEIVHRCQNLTYINKNICITMKHSLYQQTWTLTSLTFQNRHLYEAHSMLYANFSDFNVYNGFDFYSFTLHSFLLPSICFFNKKLSSYYNWHFWNLLRFYCSLNIKLSYLSFHLFFIFNKKETQSYHFSITDGNFCLNFLTLLTGAMIYFIFQRYN